MAVEYDSSAISTLPEDEFKAVVRHVLKKAEHEESYLQQLLDNPTGVFLAAGMKLKAGIRIKIVTNERELGQLGKGEVPLYLQISRQLDIEQLKVVNGGDDAARTAKKLAIGFFVLPTLLGGSSSWSEANEKMLQWLKV